MPRADSILRFFRRDAHTCCGNSCLRMNSVCECLRTENHVRQLLQVTSARGSLPLRGWMHHMLIKTLYTQKHELARTNITWDARTCVLLLIHVSHAGTHQGYAAHRCVMRFFFSCCSGRGKRASCTHTHTHTHTQKNYSQKRPTQAPARKRWHVCQPRVSHTWYEAPKRTSQTSSAGAAFTTLQMHQPRGSALYLQAREVDGRHLRELERQVADLERCLGQAPLLLRHM